MNINKFISNGEYANEIFLTTIAADNERIGTSSFLYRWLFAEKLTGRGLRAEMNFNAYEGISHLKNSSIGTIKHFYRIILKKSLSLR
jgi:hypothetical protein